MIKRLLHLDQGDAVTSSGPAKLYGGEKVTRKIEAVTVDSPPEKIILNFQVCGYFAALTDDLEKQAIEDPKGWLAGHPYLYAWYPRFFVDVSGKVRADKATVVAASKHS